jgi:hypothetical protein
MIEQKEYVIVEDDGNNNNHNKNNQIFECPFVQALAIASAIYTQCVGSTGTR